MSGPEEVATTAEPRSQRLVTFSVQSQCYAVPIETVVEMTLLRDLDPIAGAPPWIRGMMQLRDSVVPILDLRTRLGLEALQDEVCKLETQLQQRKKDHVLWLETLEKCCETGARFELQKDPTQCAFGLWFYAFTTEDAILANLIAKFEEPHNHIHALADRCLGMAAEGNQEGARSEIDSAREIVLKDMILLFDATVREIKERSRQMVVILRGEEENLGLAVDRLESVATVDCSHVDPRPLRELESGSANLELLVTSVVRSEADDGLIQVLAVDRIFDSAGIGYANPESEAEATDGWERSAASSA